MLYISTSDPRGAEVLIEVPRRPTLTGFPMTIKVDAGATELVRFPVGINGNNDIRVSAQDQATNGVHVSSLNGAGLTIFGINDEIVSSDGFLALPCDNFIAADGSFSTTHYKYFVFSTGASTGSVNLNSRFLIVPCTADNSGITYRLPGTTTDNHVRSLAQYETFLIQRSSDLTGTIITSNSPLAVFVGHECGNVPVDLTACDHLVEQVPSSVAFGKTFFAIPFALRESGDIFKIGSVMDNNEVSITCSRRTASGATKMTTTTAMINAGSYHEHKTFRRKDQSGLSSEDYRREFCCIETSKPAIVMQYILGHSADLINLVGIAGELGDPSMSLVPPVEQYRNNLRITTADGVRTVFRSFMSWAIPSQFFNPAENDESNFKVNGTTFLPASRNQMGSGEYIPIHCSNGQVCGYGGFSPLTSGPATVSYNSPQDTNAAVYTFVYGFLREISYAFPAGYECEPIGCEFLP